MKKILFVSAAFAFAAMMTGCNNNSGENTYYPNYLMTVKTDTANNYQCYLQLDNNTTAYPTNSSLKTNPYGKQVRALGYVNEIENMVGTYNKSCHVCWMDSLLTKQPVMEKDTTWGGDAVDILNSWTTILEDDYLTLSFRAYYHISGHVHTMNLVYGINPNDPFEVLFTHDAHEGSQVLSGASFSGTVAFDLRKIPGLVAERDTVVTVRYQSPIGEKVVKFAYPLSQPYGSSDYVGAVTTEEVR